jgi:hypothetical protein
MQAEGGCLCGAVRYSFDSDGVVTTAHCHCTDCQKSTGSGKATILILPTEALEISGELKSYTVTGTAGSHVTRGFCPACGSPVMSQVEEDPSMRFIKAGSLDDSSWVQANVSFWSGSAHNWSPVDDSIPGHVANPEF